MTTHVKIEADPIEGVEVVVQLQDTVYGPSGPTTEVDTIETHRMKKGETFETYIHQTRRLTVLEVMSLDPRLT